MPTARLTSDDGEHPGHQRRGGAHPAPRANLTETNAAADISTSGTLTISDGGQRHATFVRRRARGTASNGYGTFAIDAANGAWTYTAGSAHNEFVAGTTYTDTFSVASADGTTHQR